jgi:hypothetical protein
MEINVLSKRKQGVSLCPTQTPRKNARLRKKSTKT